jgi:hypothetical protein
MHCIICKENISEYLKREILGPDLYAKIEAKYMDVFLQNTIKCVSCKENIQFEKGNVDYKTRDEKNQPISKEACEHYANHRCRCPNCKVDFCVGCNSTPYHIGKTCEQHLQFVSAKKCKYCNAVINNSNKGLSNDVCSNLECAGLFKSSCTKVLRCGHNCYGCKGEKTCPPCLNVICKDNPKYFDQDEDSYCNICFSEGLGASPIVLLSCKHFMHHKCVEQRLKKKWIGPKITFGFANCPQCNSWLDCPNNPDLQTIISAARHLYDDISKKAIERLKFEGLHKDPRLIDPNSQWYGKDLEFALHKTSYYMCYECNKPYFAGLRECRGGPNDDNNPNRNDYDPKDLICGAHANIAGVAGKTECEKHGKEFIEYKCKYCCNIASWFCWGTTHFCEDCHARQCKGDYVSKYAKDKLPKCSGPSKCVLKVKHPENGEEFALGCSVCRNNSENMKDF